MCCSSCRQPCFSSTPPTAGRSPEPVPGRWLPSRCSQARIQKWLTQDIDLLLIALFTTTAVLLLIDHGHFQYNSLSLGLALGGAAAIMAGADVLGSVLYCCSFCHKQAWLQRPPAAPASRRPHRQRHADVNLNNTNPAPDGAFFCPCLFRAPVWEVLMFSTPSTRGHSPGHRRGAYLRCLLGSFPGLCHQCLGCGWTPSTASPWVV